MIKNLIIGYIKVHQPQEKKQVLKLIGTMLNFTPAENEQIESSSAEQSGKWFASLLKSSTSTPTKSGGGGGGAGSQSFTELLIQYVDRESRPKANLKFDLNDASLGASKKTDTTPSSLLLSQPVLDMSNTESAVKFFNNSLIGSSELVNRGSQQPASQQSSTNTQNVADSILEQILK